MRIKNICLLFVLMLLLVFISSCAASGGADSMSPGAGSMGGSDSKGEYAPDGGGVVMPDMPGDETLPGQGNNDYTPQPGQLTAAAYDDNEYYDFWKSLSLSQDEVNKIFYEFHTKYAFNTSNRIHLTLPKGLNIKVELYNSESELLYSTYSDKSGNCYLYPKVKLDEYTVKLTYLNSENEQTVITEVISGNASFEFEGLNSSSNYIQLMFVIDATGSMMDEMSYVKAEVIDIIDKIKTSNPDVVIELAFMVYRDLTDAYITKYFDFSQDIKAQQAKLSEQYADGGGDYEEAVDVALEEAANKQWSETATKILIHIADAPSHDKDVEAWYNTTLSFASKGIKVVTVASSGIDKKAEYFFRSQSMITNAHYVYLTNDSGIGGNHLEPTMQISPVVEYLNSCLVRLINGYYTGEFSEPVYYQQEQ